jgi:cytochrome c556
MNKQIKQLMALSVLTAATWGGFSYAHSEHFTKNTRTAEPSYDFRSATMSIYKWYLSPMGAMVKGKVPFDAKAFTEYAKGLEAISKIDLLEGFPKDSGEDHIDDSDAKEEIWANWDDFKHQYGTLQSEAKNLLTIAKAGDEKAIKAQFKKTAATCGSCHKKYKTK